MHSRLSGMPRSIVLTLGVLLSVGGPAMPLDPGVQISVESTNIDWETIVLPTPTREIECYLGERPGIEHTPTLCIILERDSRDTTDPRYTYGEQYPWDGILDRGGRVLVVQIAWSSKALWERYEAGEDPWGETVEEVRAIVKECLRRELTEPGRIVLMGISKYGYLVLEALAKIPEVGGAVGHQPVTRYRTDYDAPVMREHDLFKLAEKMVPRPVLLQVGTNDFLAPNCYRMAAILKELYVEADMPEATLLHLLKVKRHSSATEPEDVQFMLDWMIEQKLLN